jgi:RNA polymerase sigma-70 factor (ECF subfamily)
MVMNADDLSANPPQAGVLNRFSRRLVGLARGRLGRLLDKIDPEDVVQSAYKSYLARYGNPGQPEWACLWGLLAKITLRKCSDRVRYYRAGCRDTRREAVGTAGAVGPWADAVDTRPGPEEEALLAETLESLFAGLREDERAVVELSLLGFSTQEISEQLGRAERSVRRLRERARHRLERMQADGLE